MLEVDIHTHTLCGHGASTVNEMFEKGKLLGLKVHGFSEHSPRPLGYDYKNEYREHLQKMLPSYLSDVEALKQNQSDVKVLLGMEVDWLEKEEAFMQKVVNSYDFDYLIAGLHFIGTWGFDADKADWDKLSYEEKTTFFTEYYKTMQKMIQSNLFNVIAHPDLIKIFCIEDFKKWIENKESQDLIKNTLSLAKKHNMAMEVSTAGLRKPCKEIYPCEIIMHMAKDLDLPISIGSDGHCVNTLCAYYEDLEKYLKKFDFKSFVYFEKGEMVTKAL